MDMEFKEKVKFDEILVDKEPTQSIVRMGLKESREDLVEFICSNCAFSAKCRFGELIFEKNKYLDKWYYLRDPFEPPNIHKGQKEYSVEDFVVVGANCFICQQPVCIDEECSTFYKHQYCLKCVNREKHSFPAELLSNISKHQTKSEKEVK